MNKNLLLFILFAMLGQASLYAQEGNPCGTPPPPGGESCNASCVYCDFDGYMGTNNGSPSGGNTVCGQISLHNDQWFGFIPQTSSITMDIITSNCQNGDGLQVAFFDDCTDADAFTCNPGCGGCGNQTFSLSWSDFTPGQTYWLMIDGWVGDVCNFEISISNGSIAPPAPDPAGQPMGPTVVCPGAVAVYTVDESFGAGYYQWTAPPGSRINGGGNTASINAPEGATITVTFGNSGGNVCVQTGNSCNPTTGYNCLPVVNQPIPPTIKPDIVICNEDLPFTWDEQPYQVLTSSGTFNLTSTPYDSYLGCDSVIRQKVIVKPLLTTNLGTRFICEGDCFTFAGDQYCDPGPQSVVLESYQNCDSLVSFAVSVLSPNAEISGNMPITCATQGGLTLSATNFTGGSSFLWLNSNDMILGGAPTVNINLTGTYRLVVTAQGGGVVCRDTAEVVVVGNTVAPGATATHTNINCISTTATLTGTSQTQGVTYQWSGPGINPTNQFQQNPVVNQPGVYVLTVTNPVNSCTSSASVTVLADNIPPGATATGGLITCVQSSVTIDGATNVPNASWNWAGPGIDQNNMNVENPVVTLSGNYDVTVTNPVNGCTNTASAIVSVNTNIPVASAGPNDTLTCTEPSILLQGGGSTAPDPMIVLWAGPNGFNASVLNPPVDTQGTYILTITNQLNGCVKRDTVDILSNQQLPNASAGADSTITCAQPGINLIGSGSSSGANYTALWTGPGITPLNQNLYNPEVFDPGTYSIRITNITSGCTSTDTVLVDINTAAPTAGAGADQLLTCTNVNGVTLSGSGTPSNILYHWSGPGIGSNNENLQNPTVTQPGTYILVVTNPVNGCTAADQAIVTQDANVPTANGGTDMILNCTVNTVNFDGSSSTSGTDITYTWSGPGISGSNITAQSPSGISVPGTYNLTVTNTSNNCQNTDIVVVLLDVQTPVANAGSDLTLNCYNNATDTIDAGGSSFGSIYTYHWSGPGIVPGVNDNLQNPVINNQPGVYNLTVTNTNNTCTSVDQVVIVSNLTAPTADAGTDKIIDCVTISTGIGGASSSGSNFSYLWTGPGITPANSTLANPVVSVPGTYSIVVTNSINGCTASNTSVVNTNAVYPTALAGNDGRLTCAVTTYTLDGSASSNGTGFTALWAGPGINAGNQGQLSPVVSAPGTYFLTITDQSNFCQRTDTVVVSQDITNPVASSGPDRHLDCQTTTVTLNGSASSSGAFFTYDWAGVGISPVNQTLKSPSVTVPGTYNLTVTNNDNGCTAVDNVVVTQDIATPAANAGNTLTITCASPTITINGSGSSSGPLFGYIWQGPGINSNNFDDNSPVVADSGLYIIIVTNTQNFCTSTASVFIDMDKQAPLTLAGPDQLLTCAITNVQLDATQSQGIGTVSYKWTGPGITPGISTLANPTVSVPGTYNVVVTDSHNGCTASDFAIVDQNIIYPVSVAGADQTITCANGATGVVLNSTGSSTGSGIVYQWSGSGITPVNQGQNNPTVLVPGNYSLLITDSANGCTSSDGVVVFLDQNLPVASAGADRTITCSVLNVTLDASASTTPGGSLNFTWAGPGITPVNVNDVKPVVNVPGVYTVTALNIVNGCSGSDQVVVNLDNVSPTIAATADLITCQDPNATLAVSSSANSSVYKWEGPGITPQNSDDASLQISEPGIYSVTVTAPNGCTSTTQIEVLQDANVPDGIAEGVILNCYNGGTGEISGTVLSPAGSTFNWTGPGIGTQTTNIVSVNQAGTYSFNMTTATGCKKTLTVQVTANFTKPNIAALATDQLDCSTPEVTISAAGTSTGPNFTYLWTALSGNIVSGFNTLSPVVDKAGTYKLRVFNATNGCADSILVPVTIDPAVPTGFNLNVRDIVCFGDTDGSITINNVIGGTPPFNFTISSANNQYTGLRAGNYVISLIDANGCELDTIVTIEEPGQLLVELGDNVEIELGEEATVSLQIANTTPLESVVWNFIPENATRIDSVKTPLAYVSGFTFNPLNSYRHTATVTDENGCIARDEVLVVVNKPRNIYVPNVFNPASIDVDNSGVRIYMGRDVARVQKWVIYDRWGSQIHEVDNILPGDFTHGWTGKVRGEDGQMGVYVWYAVVEFIDGEVIEYKGDVTLVR